MDLKIDDPDKLKETYNLEMAIELTRSNRVKYDLHDVFTVVEPHKDPNEFETVNLYTYHTYLTSSEIVQSNEWYATMPEDTHHKYFLHNIKLMHEDLVKIPQEKLATKFNETYL